MTSPGQNGWQGTINYEIVVCNPRNAWQVEVSCGWSTADGPACCGYQANGLPYCLGNCNIINGVTATAQSDTIDSTQAIAQSETSSSASKEFRNPVYVSRFEEEYCDMQGQTRCTSFGTSEPNGSGISLYFIEVCNSQNKWQMEAKCGVSRENSPACCVYKANGLPYCTGTCDLQHGLTATARSDIPDVSRVMIRSDVSDPTPITAGLHCDTVGSWACGIESGSKANKPCWYFGPVICTTDNQWVFTEICGYSWDVHKSCCQSQNGDALPHCMGSCDWTQKGIASTDGATVPSISARSLDASESLPSRTEEASVSQGASAPQQAPVVREDTEPCSNIGAYRCARANGVKDGQHVTQFQIGICSPRGVWVLSAYCGASYDGGPPCCEQIAGNWFCNGQCNAAS
jgi:hypothetical protein